MTMDFDVLGILKKSRIGNNMENSFIVTNKSSKVRVLHVTNIEINKQKILPSDFTTNSDYYPIFSLAKKHKTIYCFFDFQEIGESPNKTQYPILEQ